MHQHSLRTRTSVAQKLPEDIQRRADVFHRHLKEHRMEEDFDYVVNMDETSVFFDLVPSRTIAEKGKRAVVIRSTGAEKRHLTAVLAIDTNGQTLDPMVIFKGKRWPSDISTVPDGLHVRLQERGWMSEALMLDWLETVLAKHTRGKRCLLILDSFAGHTTEAVREKMLSLNVLPVIIPGGCTSTLQPLDVSINKPFKDHIRTEWMHYMRTTETADDRIPTASRQTVIQWVNRSWNTISDDPLMVTRSFQATGISTALEDAAAELRRREENLRQALETDDESQDFLGFPATTDCTGLYGDSHNPFLDDTL